MKPPCPYERNRRTDGQGIVGCSLLSAACGFGVANAISLCDFCMNSPAWEKKDLLQEPYTVDQAIELINSIPVLRHIYKQTLCNRLIAGNSRTTYAHMIDVPTVAARFKTIATEEERREVVKKAIESQCVLPEHYGRSSFTIYADLVELENGLEVRGVLSDEGIRNVEDVETQQWLHDELGPDRPCQSCR